MPTAVVDIEELRKIIMEDIRVTMHEIFKEEFSFKLMELVLRNVPSVSEEEQKEIEELYGEPSHEVAEVLVLEH